MIITRTPFRISFAGGGTDLRAFYKHEPGQVISTSINKYIYVVIKKQIGIVEHKYRINWSKVEFKDTIDQIAISGGPAPSIGWQMLSYLIITIAEILISITCLEFAYTQAPKTMKSIVMGFYLASVSVGNAVTAGVIYFNENADGTLKLEGADFFWFFTLLIAVTAILFLLVLKFYIPKTYIQDEE